MKYAFRAGMIIIMLAACGCNESRDAKAQKEQVAQLLTKSAILEARVKAVEEACLELNSRISGLAANQYQAPAAAPAENATQPLAAPAAAAASAPADAPAPAPQQQNGGLMNLVSSSPDLHARPTRQNFSRRMMGRTLTEVLSMLGKPDKTEEKDGAKHWTYNALVLDVEKGGVEQCPALIVLEGDAVTRAQLLSKP